MQEKEQDCSAEGAEGCQSFHRIHKSKRKMLRRKLLRREPMPIVATEEAKAHVGWSYVPQYREESEGCHYL